MPREFTEEDLRSQTTYDALLAIEDETERQAYLFDLKDSARRLKFGVPNVNERVKLAKQRFQAAQRGDGSKWTLFKDAPFPPVRCGQYDATDLGVWRYEIDNFGTRNRISACELFPPAGTSGSSAAAGAKYSGIRTEPISGRISSAIFRRQNPHLSGSFHHRESGCPSSGKRCGAAILGQSSHPLHRHHPW